YQYSNGVSVFFPWSREAYEASRKNYKSLWFAKDVKRKQLSWTDFLEKYLYDVSLRRCDPTDPDVPVGSRVRYRSGVLLDEQLGSAFVAGNGAARTKISGQEGTKISGQEGTKISGQEGTKISGQEGTKISGQEGTKISGQEGTKIAGQEGTRIAGGGANAIFSSLRLFKNIESRWDISGFTKKPEEASIAASMKSGA
ncbi:MAG TPA: hypothetical protein VFH31_16680, partial [Pyrinomonadaceae bacterium]|nr:hypothetical protein [Pyrinomonadaceae bacterium]